ncbi:(2Fe-2S) ferredoxin domain-containing protein [Fervidobacterium thailandense]|uniref:(2Fe-2S) ferredoxin domain-containing protein n=1 Tax=Fervidobacterium thailandense TaxID=1008305 RepID=A0A1E3G1N6_9BACT|nr:NAD(P)H-dependent oxidoreductase subunit E [Fervidobacterium thailandense]ODN29773.1 hypothetical protein A4H02_08955 [Fervidobacterium thailandense]
MWASAEKKLIVRVCMGSSCHLKGSYDVVKKLRELFEGRDDVELLGSLCMNNCSKGINVEINGKIVSKLTPENATEVVLKEIRRITGNETQ